MSRRRESDELQKHTLNLFKGDYAELQGLYPESGAGKIIRILVRNHLRKVREEVERRTSDGRPQRTVPGGSGEPLE